MLLKTLAEFGATQERETRIVLDLIGCGDLPSDMPCSITVVVRLARAA